MDSAGLFDLEYLVSEDSFALFDNNILVGPLRRPGRYASREAKIEYIHQNLDFYRSLARFLNGGSNFFVTEGVWQEYHNFSPEIRNSERSDYGLKKAQKSLTKGRRKLARQFKKNGRVLRLDDISEKEMYWGLHEEYHKILKNSYGVSDVDVDLLFSAVVLSTKRGPTALISNDFGIHRSWDFLESQEEFSTDQLRYFIKEDFDGYRLLT